MGRGTLRIHLGAAPGVGKTVAMLDEGRRRLARGTDVVVAFAETHGREHTARCLDGLPVVPRRTVTHRGGEFTEMDLDAVLARHPQVALVDELAHTNVPGSGVHERRWQDVETLLDAGIDVISTLNVQHLESLNDVVAEITGVPQRETVPDAVVRAADQIELVDMAPEALRRRMAHGNVYPPERVDAALGNYFRVGNLTALRELALLWLADSVEEGLQRYRTEHGITGTWETKERIVVALTGGPEGDTLIRRAARIAARTVGGELLAVHVSRNDGLSGPGVAGLAAQRLLVESLGGSYHSVVGDSVPATLLEFARGVDATQIVLGASRHSWVYSALTGPGTGATVTRMSGPIDVHLVSHDYSGGRGLRLPRLTGGLTARRRWAGLVFALVVLPLLTLACTAGRDGLDFAADVPLYLLVVVVTSLIGGFYPALSSAVAASLLLNFYFVEPTHTFTIDQPANILAVVVFLLIAVAVSQVVDVAARRSVLAARAAAEAETLSTFAGSLLRGEQALPALLERVRETFAMAAAALLVRGDSGWLTAASSGPEPPADPDTADAAASVQDDIALALRGHELGSADRRVLGAFAAHVAVAYQQQRLAEAARRAEPLAESDRQRTALLNAVSHDLRTPIASAKAAVSSLRGTDVAWTPDQQQELLAAAEDALDRLTGLVTNLLDLSRLQVGELPVVPGTVAVEDVVARALGSLGDVGGRIDVRVPADLPEVVADPGLLERVVANVVQNALRYSPPQQRVRLAASTLNDRVEIRVVDRGPGFDPALADRAFQPFHRAHDVPSDGAGVGLGLAIARGFTEAMGGTVSAETTPGGGATLVITLTAA